MKIFLENGKFFIKDRKDISKLINEEFNIKNNGMIDKIDVLFLHEYRNADVYEKNEKLKKENILKFFNEEDIRNYKIYSDLRNRGYVIKIDYPWLIKNKETGEFQKFYIFLAKDNFNPWLFKKRNGIVAVVDPMLEINYYTFFFEEPKGEFNENYENLNLDEFEMKIIEDLRKRGCAIKSGLKYGTEFIVYVKRDEKHSRYMLKIYLERMIWLDITALVRVSHGVKKILLIAFNENGIKYLGFRWLRA